MWMKFVYQKYQYIGWHLFLLCVNPMMVESILWWDMIGFPNSFYYASGKFFYQFSHLYIHIDIISPSVVSFTIFMAIYGWNFVEQALINVNYGHCIVCTSSINYIFCDYPFGIFTLFIAYGNKIFDGKFSCLGVLI